MRRLSRTWRELWSSLWFLPTAIVAVAMALALGLVALDHRLGASAAAAVPLVFGTEPAASRDILSVVANSMLTAAALVFSLTIVALTLASTQFTPRILRNFVRDRTTQVVIGVFVGVFVYCLIVLRTIREGDQPFVPALAVTVGAASGLIGMGALIYFVHHIARSIQASNIIASIAAETVGVVEALYPAGGGRGGSPAGPPAGALAGRSWVPVPAAGTGYIQSIDTEELVALASRLRGVIRMEYRVGEFVVAGSALASFSADEGDAGPGAAAARRVNDFCTVATTRTIDQDVAFGLRQMVDIALKALSAAVNDTTTAINCVDYLSDVVARLSVREVGEFHHYGADGRTPRVVAPGQTFEDFFDLAFNQIRQNAGGNVAVILRLARGLREVARIGAGGPAAAEVLGLVAAEMAMLAELAERSIPSPGDRAKALRHIGRYASAAGVPGASRNGDEQPRHEGTAG